MKEALKLSTVITFIIIVISFIAYEWREDHNRDADRAFAYSYKKTTRSDKNAIDHGYPIPAAKLECYKRHGMYVKNPETNHWIKLTIDRGIPFYIDRHFIQDAFVPHIEGYSLTDTLASCTADGRFFIDNLALKESTDYTRYEIMGLVLAVFLIVFYMCVRVRDSN